MLKSDEYRLYLEDLIEAAFVRKMSDSSEISVDEESYEEVRAISLDLEEALTDLEQ